MDEDTCGTCGTPEVDHCRSCGGCPHIGLHASKDCPVQAKQVADYDQWQAERGGGRR